MAEITFNQDSSEHSFSTRLKQEINEYFKDKSTKGTAELTKKTDHIFTGLVISYCVAMLSPFILGSGIVGTIVMYLGFLSMGIFITLAGFNIMHDAAHGSYSDDTQLNKKLTYKSSDILGASSYFWDKKHNFIHHTYTNILGKDHDISKNPMFRFAPTHPWFWFHRFQHYYCWIGYMLMTLYWFYYDDFVVYFRQRIGDHKFVMKKEDKKLFWKGKLTNIGIFIVIPVILLGWDAVWGLLLLHAVVGLSLAIVFQLAHVVEGVSFFEKDDTLEDWHVHEVLTTADFATDSKLLSYLLGGLNFQVEHHLFRRVSHVHYPAVQKIVKKVCEEFGIKYTSFPTFGAAIVSHYRHLKKLGRAA